MLDESRGRSWQLRRRRPAFSGSRLRIGRAPLYHTQKEIAFAGVAGVSTSPLRLLYRLATLCRPNPAPRVPIAGGYRLARAQVVRLFRPCGRPGRPTLFVLYSRTHAECSVAQCRDKGLLRIVTGVFPFVPPRSLARYARTYTRCPLLKRVNA